MGEYCFCFRSSVNCNNRESAIFREISAHIYGVKTYTLTTSQGLLGSSIEIGTELGESSNLTVLGQEKLQGTSDLLHGLKLGSGTDTRDGQTDVDGRSDTLVEQLGLQEDLAVGNGNDVGGNVGRHVTTLGLNDGQGSHGTATVLVVELGSTLQQTGVQVENVTGVSLTSRRTTEQQRHLTVGDSLLGQIVIDDEGMFAGVSEVLAAGKISIEKHLEVRIKGQDSPNGSASERSNVLQRSGLGGSSSDDDGVLHGVVLLEGLDKLSDGGSLLADGDVDAVKLLGLVAGVVPSLLVENGVESDGSLTSLTVTNDQLTLTTADGNHGVNGLETSLHGLVDRLARQDTRSLELGTALLLGVERTLAVNGVTQSIDDTAEQLRANGDVDLYGELVNLGDIGSS